MLGLCGLAQSTESKARYWGCLLQSLHLLLMGDEFFLGQVGFVIINRAFECYWCVGLGGLLLL
jgi:hypothetical protein